ncbi:MAG: aldo/keto reductase [Candidatus Hydrogenedentes bacterium]|nr:aldo/keto reductase [Candidatus Hydrogenedentota bacterium]
MNHVRFGKTGLLVSELCLGTMTFGNEADEETSRRLMDTALDRGINFFDTAHNYNRGLTEEIVGRWIGPHRDGILLASKVFFPFGGGPNDEGLSRRNIIASVERSLRRLQTDYLDILYLHHWDVQVPVGESMRALHTLIEQGKVRYGGVSNFSAWQTVEAQRAADGHNLHTLVCVQPMYSLLKRQVEVEILPMAAHEGLAVVPYNAIGAGMLTGKYLEGGTGRLDEAEMYRQRYADPSYGETTRRFVSHARARGDSPAALAVAWVMGHPTVTSTLIGARTLEQFDDTLGCLNIRLSSEEREAISALSPTPPHATDRESMAAMKTRGW